MPKQKPRHRSGGAPRAGGHSGKPNAAPGAQRNAPREASRHSGKSKPAPPAHRNEPREASRHSGKPNPAPPVQRNAPREAPRHHSGKPHSAPPAQRNVPREAPRHFSTPNPVPPAQRDAPREAPRQGQELWIYGHHPVAAALANPLRKVLRLVASTEGAAKLNAERGVPERALSQLSSQSRREIEELVGTDAVHQGVAVLVRLLEHDLADVLEAITAENVCIVVLDQVTDPHNVGAIMRSAAAFGAAVVVAPDRHAPDESGTMAKSASGALDKIPYVKAGNLVRALEVIKEHRFWLVGLDADTSKNLADIDLKGRIALVLGAEGEGLRRLVRETCDHIAALPMTGDMKSLNVSNAAAVALYERARQVPRGKP